MDRRGKRRDVRGRGTGGGTRRREGSGIEWVELLGRDWREEGEGEVMGRYGMALERKEKGKGPQNRKELRKHGRSQRKRERDR